MARRSYSEQFKKELVEESISSNRSIASIAEEHDLHPNVLRNWIKKYGGNAVGSSKRGRKKSVAVNNPIAANDEASTTGTIELYPDSTSDEYTLPANQENTEKDLLTQINRLAAELRALKEHSPVAIFAENVNVYTDKTK